ncbi:LytTR family DNA-binding domain-containing protein [Neogemmobacter tilapiae]|uniref:HTH LytTR-type domain-containing protein n=1 Tax=Neogemmobacter tilapiae TaxID=875041 RepID=A0A918WR67_9RHOB|nr:LytTR family DNA-binding domain-containing protein [Gemmobacter tilapiae]GHC66716.1 hypothetical protein GCM10007315_34490 [Gemmobacter tilapiae]
MGDRDASFTLRELRDHLVQTKVVVALLGIAVVLTVSGPFNTLDNLATLPRAIYWTLVAVLSYITGALVSMQVNPRLAHLALLWRVLLSSAVVCLGVTVTLFLINAGFGQFAETWSQFLRGIGSVFIICVAIALADEFQAKPESTLPEAPEKPNLLDRLPLEKRGVLICLSVQDHYVDVVTSKGREMLLLRLSDAIRETGAAGLQVHRSHWVARDQVRAARRQGDGAVLTMANGLEIPVSRTYLPQVRAAGLLPVKGTQNG